MEKGFGTHPGFIGWFVGFCVVLGAELVVKECVLMERENMTCYWESVDPETTSYVLTVNKTNCANYANYESMGQCNATKHHCTVKIGSVSHCFCVAVLASSGSGSTRSRRLCFIGINHVKMYPPQIESLTPLSGKDGCLSLIWTERMSKYITSEMDYKILQIVYKTFYQKQKVLLCLLHDWKKELCGLYPGTKHYVKVRAQDTRAKHWSSWSNEVEATTLESAPASAPKLWRHIQPLDRTGWRRISLLWKPLQWPDTNGIILSYAASCWSDLNSSSSDCGVLSSSKTSCLLSISNEPHTCMLTAANSAGVSPPALLHVPGVGNADVLPPPLSLSLTALDDQSLKVEWTSLLNESDASFVVQWFAISENTDTSLHWEYVNGSARSLNISDGVWPEVPYNVSVQILSKKTEGAARSAIAFTRQGVPSVGPNMHVVLEASSSVVLKWDPVPLEKLRGFVQSYTVMYNSSREVKSHELGGDVGQFCLRNLSPGEYKICVRVHTKKGAVNGPWMTVSVGDDNIPVLVILLCSMGSLLIVIILVILGERIQRHLCATVPDPSKSSLSSWPSASQSQHKLTVLDFKPSHSLFEPIYVGGMKSRHDLYHQELSSVWPLIYNTIPLKSENNPQTLFPRPVLAKTDNQMLWENRFKELNHDLTLDLCYKSKSVTKLQSSLQTQMSSSCPAVTESCSEDFGSGLDPHFHTYVSPCCPEAPDLRLRADHFNSLDPLYKDMFRSQMESCGYTHVSTSYLPTPFTNAGKESDLSANLHCKNDLFLRLQSCCYVQLSSSYLPFPETKNAHLPMETEDTKLQSPNVTLSTMSSNNPSSYIPFPLSESDNRNKTVDPIKLSHQNDNITGADSDFEPILGSSFKKASPQSADFILEDVYRPLRPEERPFLQVPLQKHGKL